MSTKPRTISKAVTGTTTLPASESRIYFFVQAGAGGVTVEIGGGYMLNINYQFLSFYVPLTQIR